MLQTNMLIYLNSERVFVNIILKARSLIGMM